ncbi:hypothetical protein MTO96_025143 [Rhipicephalus appendiculatus]
MALTRSQARKLSQELDLVPCSKTTPAKATELCDLGSESNKPPTENSQGRLLEPSVAEVASVVSDGGETEVAPLGETGSTITPPGFRGVVCLSDASTVTEATSTSAESTTNAAGPQQEQLASDDDTEPSDNEIVYPPFDTTGEEPSEDEASAESRAAPSIGAPAATHPSTSTPAIPAAAAAVLEDAAAMEVTEEAPGIGTSPPPPSAAFLKDPPREAVLANPRRKRNRKRRKRRTAPTSRGAALSTSPSKGPHTPPTGSTTSGGPLATPSQAPAAKRCLQKDAKPSLRQRLTIRTPLSSWPAGSKVDKDTGSTGPEDEPRYNLRSRHRPTTRVPEEASGPEKTKTTRQPRAPQVKGSRSSQRKRRASPSPTASKKTARLDGGPVAAGTTICQRLLAEYEERLVEFQRYVPKLRRLENYILG